MRSLPGLAMYAAVLLAQPAMADPTDVDVRVIARGAKFLGGYAAPVRIVMTDADTGETLARGTTSGTTGDTGIEQMVFAEAGSVMPLLASDAYHRGHWRERVKRGWAKLFA